MFLREDDQRIPAIAPTDELPNKLSALLRIAVEDAEKVQRLGHKLEMGTWLIIKTDACAMCMAGAIMFARHKYTMDDKTGICFFPNDEKTTRSLYAVDEMRKGYFPMAALNLGISICSVEQDRAMGTAESIVRHSYTTRDGGRATWQAYLQAADVLEEAGL